MGGRACWAVGLLFVLLRCASAPASHPVLTTACVVTCPAGYSFRRQHLCRSDRRWFTDVLVKDHIVTRGVDGDVLTDVYVTDQGDYAAIDVVKMSCPSYIRTLVLAQEPDKRGVHPGEPDPLHPNGSPW